MRLVSAWAPVVGWCALIFFGSTFQGSPVPMGGWPDFLMRKAAHVFEYAVLFLLTRRAGLSGPRAFAFCVLYGISDEWHQNFVPFREGTLRDVLIDAGGAALAWATSNRLARPRPRW